MSKLADYNLQLIDAQYICESAQDAFGDAAETLGLAKARNLDWAFVESCRIDVDECRELLADCRKREQFFRDLIDLEMAPATPFDPAQRPSAKLPPELRERIAKDMESRGIGAKMKAFAATGRERDAEG